MVFLSYSRVDSEFALRLAKDLRDSGINLWVDQLDIMPGVRWDKSTEVALNSAETILLILSPESVESENVMDEVSYALEHKKNIIPIIIRACNVPFRLRRFQQTSFLTNYDVGLFQLYNLFGIKTKEEVRGNIEFEKAKPKPVLPKWVLYIFFGIAIMFAGWFFINSINESKLFKSDENPVSITLRNQQNTVTGKNFFEDLQGDVKSVEVDISRALYDLKVWSKDPSDTIWSPKRKSYDKNGNLIKEEEYSILDNKYYDAIVYEYKDGNIYRFLEYGIDKKLNHVNTVLKIEPQFKITKFVTESKTDHLNNDTAYLTWSGNHITKVTFSKNKYYMIMEYNDKGHPITLTNYDSSNTISEVTKFEYLAFDERGNWTKRVDYNKNDPKGSSFFAERKIVYFQ